MDVRIPSCRFEKDGKYFALVTPDGRLKVWDCVNGHIKHDVAPESHLGSSKLTCLSWRNSPRFRQDKKKRRKRKADDSQGNEQGVDIGLGTNAGNIFIFDLLTGDITVKLEGGHNDRVNDINWNNKKDLIYACSDDRYISEWAISTQELKCKWKADKTSVRSIEISLDGNCLLSAGRDIRLWDLENKEILKKFTGHATAVSQLLFTPLKSEGVASNSEESIDTNGYYFLSGAQEDRFLNAWKVDVASQDKSSIVSFAVSDEPVSLEMAHHPTNDNPLHLIVVSKDGQLHLFQQSLNGHVKKPVKPKTTLQLATPGSKEATTEPVAIICARFVDGNEPSMVIAYGSSAKPQFEVLKYEELDKNVCLVRDYQSGLLLREENNNQRTQSTNKALVKENQLTTLGTENMAVARPSYGDSGSTTRGKKTTQENAVSSSQELSMEEMLRTMNVTPTTSSKEPSAVKAKVPQAGSVSQMLIQALNSQDQKLLENVLSNTTKPAIIHTTVKRLPVNYLVPFIQELVQRIQAKPLRGCHLLPWIKSIMTQHMSYLISVPNLVESLGGLYQLFESRVGVYSRLCKLQGRLDLMLAQVSAQTREVVEEEQLAEPLTVFKESDETSESDEEDQISSGSVESMNEDHSEDDAEESEDDDQGSHEHSNTEGKADDGVSHTSSSDDDDDNHEME